MSARTYRDDPDYQAYFLTVVGQQTRDEIATAFRGSDRDTIHAWLVDAERDALAADGRAWDEQPEAWGSYHDHAVEWIANLASEQP